MLITVRVHPRASRAKTSWNGEQLEVWVTAPPVGGAANAAVLKAVASHLKVPASAVSLRSGARSRSKLVEVVEGGGRSGPPPKGSTR
jgi:uncharacterized protein (TIGR00251 family)